MRTREDVPGGLGSPPGPRIRWIYGIVAAAAVVFVVSGALLGAPPLALGGGLALLLAVGGVVAFRPAARAPDVTPYLSVQDRELRILEGGALERGRRAYENLFEIVPCYISVQDRSFRIMQTNRLFRQDFGEGDGARCYEVYKGRDSVCPNCPVEKTFADGQVHSSEETVTTRSGRQDEVIVYSMPVRDERGEIGAVMEVSTNITEVKRLQHQLALMGLAVAGMAHRIKNILMGLEGGIFVVNTGFELADQETINDGWGMVERNVEKISRTVKDLLYCAKRREGGIREGVSPAKILREVHELYRQRAAKDGIALALEIAPEADGDHRGHFDPDGLLKLLTNLAANALDACRFDPAYGDKAHLITLRCLRDRGGNTVFEVEDNGAGIPGDVHHKVFESFFSTKGTEGTGLGLLLVQKVVEEHGGQITFTSAEGRGTRFRAVLPGLPAPEGDPAPEQVMEG